MNGSVPSGGRGDATTASFYNCGRCELAVVQTVDLFTMPMTFPARQAEGLSQPVISGNIVE